ncbi:hypothetical protein BH20ACT16_BH20ACT16_10500 [soil metagenome]
MLRRRKSDGGDGWDGDSWRALAAKYAGTDMSAFTPTYE